MRRRALALVVFATVTVLAVVVLAGCKVGTSSEPDGGKGDGATEPTSAASGGESASAREIPPGSEFAEGGGGPVSYSFREEWRRALPTAEEWRAGAYLVSAIGQYVNDQGVPSEWRMTFIDRENPDALLWVTIDPWGKVTASEEKTGDAVTSNVSEYDRATPYDVIDSDEAVRIASETLADRYPATSTKDPRIALGHSEIDGSGPYWTYSVFHNPSADYVMVRIDALTGEAELEE